MQSRLKSNGLPWEIAKGFDGAAVVGKWIDKSEISDLQNINFSLLKNKEVVQNGNTSHMIWGIEELIEHVSKYFMLKKGISSSLVRLRVLVEYKRMITLKAELEKKNCFQSK